MAKTKNRTRSFADRVAEYVHSDRLKQKTKAGNKVSCLIDGNYGTYRTQITLAGKRVKEAECSCPSDYWPCKHAGALALTYAEAPKSFVDVDKLLTAFNGKPVKELLAVMRRMILAAPASLQALGINGFAEEDEEDDFE